MTADASLPTVTVVIPARNEGKTIGLAIASVSKQDYPAERVEIIVVDNGSTDDTVKVAKASGARVLIKLNCRVGAVRNEGARQGRGELIAFLDSDCEAGPDWLRKSAELLLSPDKIGATGGIYQTPEDATWVERAWAPYRQPVLQTVEFLACSSLVIRRATFEGLNGFDEVMEAAEDDDLSRRVRQLGLRVLSVPECAVIHHGYPQKLLAIARRQLWHGTNQLESARHPLDRLLLLTHAFLLGELTALAGLFISLPIVGAGLLLLSITVAAATIGRMTAYRYPSSGPVAFGQVYAVLFFYFAGRSLGLLKNYLQLCSPRRKNKAAT